MGVPLGIASLLYLASFAVRVLGRGLPCPVRDLCLAVTCAGWALFVVDYAVRRRRGSLGARFVHRHWLDSVVVLLPLLRPVRVMRVYDAVRKRKGHPPRLSLQGRVMLYAAHRAPCSVSSPLSRCTTWSGMPALDDPHLRRLAVVGRVHSVTTATPSP